jgi:hypothetical protein
LSVSYASSFSNTIQNLPKNLIPINFEANHVDPPVNITHPVGNDQSLFLIQDAGVYLISWTVTGINSGNVEDTINIALFNAGTQQPFTPAPFQAASVPANGGQTSLTGQLILSLPATITLQLQVISSTGTSAVITPTFNIVQIS